MWESLVSPLSNSISINLSVIFTQLCTAVVFLAPIQFYKIKKFRRVSLVLWALSIIYLLLSSIAQNAMGISLFPSQRNLILFESRETDTSDYTQFENHCARVFLSQMNRKYFDDLDWNKLQQDVLASAVKIEKELKLNLKTRPMKAKGSWGLNAWLGLAYQGAAYYDPILSEVTIPKDWKFDPAFVLQSYYHECAHAFFSLSEKEATVLEFLLLWNSEIPEIQALAAWMVVSQSPELMNKESEFFKSEVVQDFLAWKISHNKSRAIYLKKHPMVSSLKSVLNQVQLQNRPSKYGFERKPPVKLPLFQSIYYYARQFHVLELERE